MPCCWWQSRYKSPPVTYIDKDWMFWNLRVVSWANQLAQAHPCQRYITMPS